MFLVFFLKSDLVAHLNEHVQILIFIISTQIFQENIISFIISIQLFQENIISFIISIQFLQENIISFIISIQFFQENIISFRKKLRIEAQQQMEHNFSFVSLQSKK